jgi:hypothetical protein
MTTEKRLQVGQTGFHLPFQPGYVPFLGVSCSSRFSSAINSFLRDSHPLVIKHRAKESANVTPSPCFRTKSLGEDVLSWSSLKVPMFVCSVLLSSKLKTIPLGPVGFPAMEGFSGFRFSSVINLIAGKGGGTVGNASQFCPYHLIQATELMGTGLTGCRAHKDGDEDYGNDEVLRAPSM